MSISVGRIFNTATTVIQIYCDGFLGWKEFGCHFDFRLALNVVNLNVHMPLAYSP